MPRACLVGGVVVGVHAIVAVLLPTLAAAEAMARQPGDAIRLVWREGDVAGHSPIAGPDGAASIGIVEYQQRIEGDVLEATRVSRFADGSADEDVAPARVAGALEAIAGRSIVRGRDGRPLVDVRIDVPNGRITGFYVDGGRRHDVDDKAPLPPGTYWGPLVFLVVKNFAANAADDRVRFRTVVPTPRPRVLTPDDERRAGRPDRAGARGAPPRILVARLYKTDGCGSPRCRDARAARGVDDARQSFVARGAKGDPP
jgi:hypothetical protein